MVTLNDLERHNGHYFACLTDSFHYIKVAKVGLALTATEMYSKSLFIALYDILRKY